MASVSAPPFHLLMVFGIVVSLLCFSQYNHFKAQLHNSTAINFQLLIFFFPFLLMFFIGSYSTGGKLSFHTLGAWENHLTPIHHLNLGAVCFYIRSLHFFIAVGLDRIWDQSIYSARKIDINICVYVDIITKQCMSFKITERVGQIVNQQSTPQRLISTF